MKERIKQLMNGVAFLIMSPLLLLYFLFRPVSDENSLFMAFSQFLSLFPGRVGIFCRKAFYRFTMNYCDKECLIGFGVLFSQASTEIERGVYIGPQCNIGMCTIKKNTLLGSGVHILSGKQQHHFSDLNAPIQEQGGTYSRVTIGEDCWLGNGAIVMANVGDKSIVAAGSVVIDDVEPYTIVAGNPARVIKKRGGE